MLKELMRRLEVAAYMRCLYALRRRRDGFTYGALTLPRHSAEYVRCHEKAAILTVLEGDLWSFVCELNPALNKLGG